MNKNIVLCGFMGSGKTVTGKALAKKLGMEFIDLDIFIEQSQNMSVKDIFASFGEPYFRTLENKAATELGKSENKVIACGGGTVLNPENVAALKVNGEIFYLSVEAQTVKNRLKNDLSRPLLAKDKENAIDTLLKNRRPIYEGAADRIIDSNGSIDYAVEQILKIIKE
ncbi:MAG: shikimate kinase [Acutalibacteraceae bacterium]|nr:shikimate kinase [Acutalibacteraceae bacterium]